MSIILDEAKQVVYQRNAAYGQPEDNFAITAELWSAYLGTPIQPEDVGMMMILLKVAREKYQHKHDNLVDIAGYAECIARLGRKRCDKCGQYAAAMVAQAAGGRICVQCADGEETGQ